MSAPGVGVPSAALRVVRDQLEEATAAAKCHDCGCFQHTVAALERTTAARDLADVLDAARATFRPKNFECRGCAVCWPAVAANAFSEASPAEGATLDLCPTVPPEDRAGWPPLPGDYRVIRYRAPVAVCTLNSDHLVDAVAVAAPQGLVLVGTLRTENLGIERIIRNVLANPNVRLVLLCGDDTRQAVGHLPGQSLVSLGENGIDDVGRIRGAKGKRPVLKNVSHAQVEAFRQQIEIVSMIGESDAATIAAAVERAGRAAPGPFTGGAADVPVDIISAPEPRRLVPDPAGYFVVYPDLGRGMLMVEHYTNAGVLDCVVEGPTPAALYATIVERRLVSRLDHAAYLGRELARAERALETGDRYIQDRAAGEIERSAVPVDQETTCGCATPCANGGDR